MSCQDIDMHLYIDFCVSILHLENFLYIFKFIKYLILLIKFIDFIAFDINIDTQTSTLTYINSKLTH